MASLDSIQTQYQKALRYFLLTKYTPAANACVNVLASLSQQGTQDDSAMLGSQEWETLRFSAWTLYANIAAILMIQKKPFGHITKILALPSLSAQVPEQCILEVWKLVVQGYGDAGDVDPRLVCSCLAMTLKLNVLSVGRHITEEWYANLRDATMDFLASTSAQGGEETNLPVYQACMQVIDLYITRILPGMNDFESAKSFVEFNPLITDGKKEYFLSVLRERQELQRQNQQKKIAQQKLAEERAKAAKEAKEAKEREAQQKAAEAAQQAAMLTAQSNEIQEPMASSSLTPAPLQQDVPSSRGSASLQVAHKPKNNSLSSNRQSVTRPSSLNHQMTIIKDWVQKVSVTGSAIYVTILLAFFALFSAMQGGRGRLSQPLKTALSKLWQTVQMGTKVTYL